MNGQLSKGVITASDLSGPLAGKTVTELTNLMKNDHYTLLFGPKFMRMEKSKELLILQTLATSRPSS